jgi:hypothetical protein
MINGLKIKRDPKQSTVHKSGDEYDGYKLDYYNITRFGKLAGFAKTGLFGGISGEIYGKSLPTMNGDPRTEIPKFLNSATGKRWSNNVKELQESSANTSMKDLIDTIREGLDARIGD